MKKLLLAGVLAGSLFVMHNKGEWMVSYRYMRMHMEDNRDGTNSLSPEEIATTIPNRFFGTPGQPPTLRVVPTEMTTDMHMFGAMYAPRDELTLMLMANYIDREMDHITFQGGAGTTRLGTFKTETKGWGDTKASALIRMYKDETHHVHFNAGLSLPTGSIKEEDNVLTPMNMRPRLRLPYAMQLGSGTYDLLPSITYSATKDLMGWGAQYNATFRLGENSQDYTLGDKHMLSLGVNAVVPTGVLKGHRFSAEVTLPIYQDLNGPQMERDNTVILGWSKAF